MAKADQLLSSLQKLRTKRDALDKQIQDGEKKLVAEFKTAAKPAPVKKEKVEAKSKDKKPAAKTASAKAVPKPAAKPLLKK